METEVRIFENGLELATVLAAEIEILAKNCKAQNRKLNIAFSGGNTPKTLFEVLASGHRETLPWADVNIFFVDERCVPPEHTESNYRMCLHSLFSKVSIPAANIHRIRGEADPESEAQRYSNEIESVLPKENNIPRFDLILLGLGEDGHTASIFPDQMGLLQSNIIYATSVHPQSGQKRIGLTGKVINAAEQVIFLVTGSNKSRITRAVADEKKRFYPASHIKPVNGKLSWYLDKAVSRSL
jgi:6-phosphogluconolactonase